MAWIAWPQHVGANNINLNSVETMPVVQQEELLEEEVQNILSVSLVEERRQF